MFHNNKTEKCNTYSRSEENPYVRTKPSADSNLWTEIPLSYISHMVTKYIFFKK